MADQKRRSQRTRYVVAAECEECGLALVYETVRRSTLERPLCPVCAEGAATGGQQLAAAHERALKLIEGAVEDLAGGNSRRALSRMRTALTRLRQAGPEA